MFSSSSIKSVDLIVNTERNTICITIITTHSTREHSSNLSRLLYRLEYNCIPHATFYIIVLLFFYRIFFTNDPICFYFTFCLFVFLR